MLVAVFVGINITKNSYALFSDSITSVNTIEVTVAGKPLDESGANAPKLDSNMIPVYYDETAEVWKKADESNTNEIYK